MKSYFRIMLDPKRRWALVTVPSISFYRYQISFKLVKG